MAFERMAGSRKPAHTRSSGAAISVVPSIFIGSPHGFERAKRVAANSQSGDVRISHEHLDYHWADPAALPQAELPAVYREAIARAVRR